MRPRVCFFSLVDRLGSDWDATVTGGTSIAREKKKKPKHQGQGASQSPTRVCSGAVSVERRCSGQATCFYRTLFLFTAFLCFAYGFQKIFTRPKYRLVQQCVVLYNFSRLLYENRIYTLSVQLFDQNTEFYVEPRLANGDRFLCFDNQNKSILSFISLI